MYRWVLWFQRIPNGVVWSLRSHISPSRLSNQALLFATMRYYRSVVLINHFCCAHRQYFPLLWLQVVAGGSAVFSISPVTEPVNDIYLPVTPPPGFRINGLTTQTNVNHFPGIYFYDESAMMVWVSRVCLGCIVCIQNHSN